MNKLTRHASGNSLASMEVFQPRTDSDFWSGMRLQDSDATPKARQAVPTSVSSLAEEFNVDAADLFQALQTLRKPATGSRGTVRFGPNRFGLEPHEAAASPETGSGTFGRRPSSRMQRGPEFGPQLSTVDPFAQGGWVSKMYSQKSAQDSHMMPVRSSLGGLRRIPRRSSGLAGLAMFESRAAVPAMEEMLEEVVEEEYFEGGEEEELQEVKEDDEQETASEDSGSEVFDSWNLANIGKMVRNRREQGSRLGDALNERLAADDPEVGIESEPL